MGYPFGYGLAVMSFVQMMLLCSVGDVVDERVIPSEKFSNIKHFYSQIFIRTEFESGKGIIRESCLACFTK